MSDELRRKNGALAEQVRRLLRTEQRFNRAERAALAQLRRIEELNELALAAATADDVGVLDRALAFLLRTFPYDQAAAFLPDEEGALRVRRVAAAPGLLGDALDRLERAAPAGGPGSALPEEPTTAPSPDVAPLLACLDAIFDGPAGQPPDAVLVIPLHLGGRVEGALVARTLGRATSYAHPLPQGDDLPLLRLLASHVRGALDAARTRARLESVVAHLPSAIFLLRGGRVVQTNEAARRLLGVPRAELDGALFAAWVPPEERASYDELEQRVAREGALRLLERRLLDGQGQPRPVELTALPVAFEGRPGILIIAEDVAERLRMRSELAFAERLATVGSLAAGVAHEINNPLTYVLHHVERLKEQLPEGERSGAAAALDGARRIRDIVRDLQTFARPDRAPAEPVDVHAVLDKVLSLAKPELRYRARVEVERGADRAVMASEGRLAQVILNLVINAARAIGEGDVERHRIRIVTAVDGDQVRIEVSDTGIGIAPPDLARIFDPFFTTDATSGSGLGLSICQSLVTGFGGTIQVASALGRGTSFVVRLPAAPEPASAPLPAPDTRAVDRARVLLIDDDPRLLRAVAAMLQPPHDVVTAEGGAAALSRLETGDFEAIVCDLMMPDVSGADVLAWLEQHRPELTPRVVVMTGGALTARSRELIRRVATRVLLKPMTAEELLAAIDEVRTRA